MDKFTLEEIEAAAYKYCAEDQINRITAELTKPKHSFREGEVVFIGDRYMLYGRNDYYETSKQPWKPARPLTLSEMPKAVEDLREAAEICYDECMDDTTLGYHAFVVNTLREALAAFDEQILGGSDE